MVRKKSQRLRITNAGMKVKVFSKQRNGIPLYGETLGIDDNGVVILAPRTDFAQLPLHHFNYFLHETDVKFIHQDPT